MTITVAVCARNAADVIKDCIQSIRQQSDMPDRFFVVIDSPDDPTAEVLNSFGVPFVINDGSGLYEARNTALKNCDTDILAFTDADCVLDKHWVRNIKRVFQEHPEVAAGMGAHPPMGRYNFAGWLHNMWYAVDANKDKQYVAGPIGGNSYFRTNALRDVGGWLPLPGARAADDTYIGKKLREVGYKIWFDKNIIAYHRYATSFRGVLKKAFIAGEDTTKMLRKAGYRDSLWWSTVAIPVMAFGGLALGPLVFVSKWGALFLLSSVLLSTFVYLALKFKSVRKAGPRWVARWILILASAVGVVKGLVSKLEE